MDLKLPAGYGGFRGTLEPAWEHWHTPRAGREGGREESNVTIHPHRPHRPLLGVPPHRPHCPHVPLLGVGVGVGLGVGRYIASFWREGSGAVGVLSALTVTIIWGVRGICSLRGHGY